MLRVVLVEAFLEGKLEARMGVPRLAKVSNALVPRNFLREIYPKLLPYRFNNCIDFLLSPFRVLV